MRSQFPRHRNELDVLAAVSDQVIQSAQPSLRTEANASDVSIFFCEVAVLEALCPHVSGSFLRLGGRAKKNSSGRS